MLLVESRKRIHIGVNFILTHMPVVDRQLSLDFQTTLYDAGINYDDVQLDEQNLRIIRRKPQAPFEIRLINVQQPQPQMAMGQLLIIDVFPDRPMASFTEEAEKITEAFQSVSPFPRQVLSKDVTLRDLYSTGGVHAFQALWEDVLGQEVDTIERLGRPVQGGGLRFVMPPRPEDTEPVVIELKIESYLKDSSKLFIEVQATWPQPTPAGTGLSATPLLRFADEYITDITLDFLGVKNHEND